MNTINNETNRNKSLFEHAIEQEIRDEYECLAWCYAEQKRNKKTISKKLNRSNKTFKRS